MELLEKELLLNVINLITAKAGQLAYIVNKKGCI